MITRVEGRNSKKSIRVLIVLLLFLAVSPPTEVHAQARYRETLVRNGGTLHGLVRLNGTAPPSVIMAITKDDKVCGSRKISPRLQVSGSGGVANSIVFLEEIREGKRWPKTTSPVLDQAKCEYEPHVMIVPAGSDLEIVNSDQVLHNVHAYEVTQSERSIFNIAQPIRGQRTPVRSTLLDGSGIVLATCDAGHPWMSAYLMMANHPYYEITDGEGRFTMTDVPPGAYRLRMWHEGVAVVKTESEKGSVKKYYFEPPYEAVQDVVVAPGGETRVEFSLTLR